MVTSNTAFGGGGGSTGLSVGGLVSPAVDGFSVGMTVGGRVGNAEAGAREGLSVGEAVVGTEVGAVGTAVVGVADGIAVGANVGSPAFGVGNAVGMAEGTAVGFAVGMAEGTAVGVAVGVAVGMAEGTAVMIVDTYSVTPVDSIDTKVVLVSSVFKRLVSTGVLSGHSHVMFVGDRLITKQPLSDTTPSETVLQVEVMNDVGHRCVTQPPTTPSQVMLAVAPSEQA
jgi:hypothetical protein